MSFNWEEYIQISDYLIKKHLKSDIPEAYLRSAISRSYYGVFNLAKRRLENKGKIIPDKNIHFHTIRMYKDSLNPTESEIGGALERLRKERITADYKEYKLVNNYKARLGHILSCQILELLNKL